MRKIIDYKTLSHEDTKMLDDHVKSYGQDGWDLHGDQYLQNGVNHIQAMVKYEEEQDTLIPNPSLKGLTAFTKEQIAQNRDFLKPGPIRQVSAGDGYDPKDDATLHFPEEKAPIIQVSEDAGPAPLVNADMDLDKGTHINIPKRAFTPMHDHQRINEKLIAMCRAERNTAIGELLKGICTECLEELEPCYCSVDDNS